MRRLHAILGIVSSLNLAILLMTGLLIQHREIFSLEEYTVGRGLLPASYRPDDGPGGVRADIVIVDLHSGRLFGKAGSLILDVVTFAWAGLLLSGITMFSSRQFRKVRSTDHEDTKAQRHKGGRGVRPLPPTRVAPR
ncbi:MAG: hypothetical protein DMG13_09040 [Acidobacteria bacterium]|nr:MAG: hypothetical protein DMG13_09040 [Acidobacteriota bacterium]